MRHIANDLTVIVFAKAPVAGYVKTRLIPLLGARGAAALQRQLIERTLATAKGVCTGHMELHCAPDCRNVFLRACAERYGARLASQTDGDLGHRMASAFSSALSRSRHVILVGTDCAVLTTDHLREAHRMLQAGADAVIAPAEDGGYALIGPRRLDARLFVSIDWGTSAVMNQTEARLSELGWQWQALDKVWDVDRPDDYRRLLASGLIDPISHPDTAA
jgi:rSAM/selenodomain-associated transferase 1